MCRPRWNRPRVNRTAPGENRTVVRAAAAKKLAQFGGFGRDLGRPASPLPFPVRGGTGRTSLTAYVSLAMVMEMEMEMRRLAILARYLLPGALAACVMSMAAPCAAQELETPAAPAAVDGSGSLFVPGGFLGVTAPIRPRVALSAYGFYYGDVDVPTAQVDLSVRATKFLTVTPSYLYYEIPPSGLNKSVGLPARFTDTFEENQFRIDGTVKFSIGGFEIADRNMYVRRFRPTDEVNRYRHRIGIAHPFAVNGHVWKAFANHEAFYEWGNGGWNRNRLSAGRDAATPEARVVSARIHLGPQSGGEGHPLPCSSV
jgi:hypothetical protein